jgi:hypothetical protein
MSLCRAYFCKPCGICLERQHLDAFWSGMEQAHVMREAGLERELERLRERIREMEEESEDSDTEQESVLSRSWRSLFVGWDNS